jgi:DNA-binding MarR family transcriptional regulator/predicted N-acetyltransferase YhbS
VAEVPAGQVAAVRAFNRFYTKRIGALNEGLLESPFSLTEMRVLYELAHREGTTAGELSTDLGLDAGYLSRILRSFAASGLLTRAPSAEDARRRRLTLTEKGRKTFAPFDRRSTEDVARMLAPLGAAERRRLVEAMKAIERLLGGEDAIPAAPVVLRAPRAGDLGWIVHRHGALYAAEYGWGEKFEAVVARVIADYLERHDPERERCWMAESGGDLVGSVLLVRKSERVAKLRLLLVEPSARGLGIGRRLVEACVDFARSRGYSRIVLWTNARLHAARAIYEKTGFRLVRSQPSAIFGPSDTEQTWELTLSRPGPRHGG